jgi:hypothetical protein
MTSSEICDLSDAVIIALPLATPATYRGLKIVRSRQKSKKILFQLMNIVDKLFQCITATILRSFLENA